MTTREVLVAARALIDTPEKWTKGVSREARDGIECRCSIAAVDDVAEGPGSLAGDCAKSVLRHFTPGPSIVVFNDAPTTTHADVMALFDRAIAACGDS